MMLTTEQKQQLLARVAAFESVTGVQLVTTLLPRCDDYPEIPWKAFASGTACAALLLVLATLWRPDSVWPSLAALANGVTLLLILGTGLVSMVLASAIPAYARLFLSGARAEGEIRQSAQALFLDHELFNTADRTAVLMLIAAFEHRVIVLADRGLRARLPDTALDQVVAAMTPMLQTGSAAPAFTSGIDQLEHLVRNAGFAAAPSRAPLPDFLEPDSRDGA